MEKTCELISSTWCVDIFSAMTQYHAAATEPHYPLPCSGELKQKSNLELVQHQCAVNNEWERDSSALVLPGINVKMNAVLS